MELADRNYTFIQSPLGRDFGAVPIFSRHLTKAQEVPHSNEISALSESQEKKTQPVHLIWKMLDAKIVFKHA